MLFKVLTLAKLEKKFKGQFFKNLNIYNYVINTLFLYDTVNSVTAKMKG